MKRRIRYGRVVLAIIIFFLFLLVCAFAGIYLFYTTNIKSVSKESEKVTFTVASGSTYSSLATSLKESNLIKSEFAYKIYLKLNEVKPLQAGTYALNRNMSVKQILEVLGSGSTENPDAIRITFKEGLVISKVAKVIAENTNHTEEEFYKVITDTTYLKQLINKYWFLTEDILNKEIYYALEGYLYPNTYEFANKDVKIETIVESMLNSMEKNLEPYKEKMEASTYSIHEIITLASMIQSEGNNVDDFRKMASVFLTRLSKKMKLQSCASAYYGEKKVMGVDEFEDAYLKSNSYNTYVIAGLPVGPISSPGVDAIDAVLNPSDSKYLYFASDKNMKVYFSETYQEHQKTINELKKAGNWYGS